MQFFIYPRGDAMKQKSRFYRFVAAEFRLVFYRNVEAAIKRAAKVLGADRIKENMLSRILNTVYTKQSP